MTAVDELDPVRAELLRAARAEAEAAVERARADAAQTLRAARADAERILARARELGAADGRAAAARERVRAAEDAWSRELAARAEVYADLRARVRAGVRRTLADRAVPPGRLGESARPGREPEVRAEPSTDLEAESRSGARRASSGAPVPDNQLVQIARALLGADALITAVPGGGVTADVPGRHLDLSADTLADRALERLGARIESLWGEP
ncbi:hypothetical protein [Streptomyces sasae]|uniref:hypothetical protein n=1 Tax=Streptomyces sasae TaxID=1266772 RepID=UPI00292D556A|nr:hypothetical protein [Streptomyces sasae]